MTQCHGQFTKLADPLKREAGCNPLPSYCHNLVASTQHNMYYSVQVKRNPFAVYADYTFEDAYFQGCEKVFDTEQEALEYFQSFEDWEQDLLVVDYHPF
jgi:hypothetical protein